MEVTIQQEALYEEWTRLSQEQTTEELQNAYKQLAWCITCGNLLAAIERKIMIINKILNQSSPEHERYQRYLNVLALYEEGKQCIEDALLGLSRQEMEAADQAAIEAIDRQFGEKFASDKIAFARKMYPGKSEKQARELRFWCGVARAFTASSVYSLPLLAAEINRLEEAK